VWEVVYNAVQVLARTSLIMYCWYIIYFSRNCDDPFRERRQS
jgi:hypothetical protein